MHISRNGIVPQNSSAYGHREAATYVDVLGNSYTLFSKAVRKGNVGYDPLFKV